MNTETARTISEVLARDLLPGDWIRTGIDLAVVESVKVGRVWATVHLVGKRTPLRVKVDMSWTVSRRRAPQPRMLRAGDIVSGREAADLLPDGSVVRVIHHDGQTDPERRTVGSDVGAGLVEYERGVSTIHPRYLIERIPGGAVRPA